MLTIKMAPWAHPFPTHRALSHQEAEPMASVALTNGTWQKGLYLASNTDIKKAWELLLPPS